MNQIHETPNPRVKARASYSGSRLTDAQFDEAWNITGILHREIHRSGSFIEKLTDYARTFAGRGKVDASREEAILRDIYAERFGQSMNKTREGLADRERTLRNAGDEQAQHYAQTVTALIPQGETMPFYQAYDRAASDMARQHGISEAGAKSMMKDAFAHAEGGSLYEVGKALEAEHHIPARDAQRAARTAERRELARTGPSR